LILDGQVAKSVVDWATTIKDDKTGVIQGVLSTKYVSASKTYSYDKTELGTKFHNRMTYLVAAADKTTKGAITNVGHTFGRFGQGKQTTLANASPFVWNAAATGNKPGLMVSLFADYTADKDAMATAWSDWSVTSGNAADISYNVKTLAAMTDFAPPATPAAATAIADGASKLAVASLVASAAVASALF